MEISQIDNVIKEQKLITEASKELATYLGWVYIPSNDLQGYSKAGWWRPLDVNKEAKLYGTVSQIVKDAATKAGSRYYMGRKTSDLKFFNSFDWLFWVVDKLEKEQLGEYFFKYQFGDEQEESSFNGIEVSVANHAAVWLNTVFDPPYSVSAPRLNLPKREQLFWALADGVKYVNKLKDEKNL